VTETEPAIGLTRMFARKLIEGGTTSDVLTAYVTKVLSPTLEPGDIVVADNLAAPARGAHTRPRPRGAFAGPRRHPHSGLQGG
jgi:transposase